jgi:hypothetical protein
VLRECEAVDRLLAPDRFSDPAAFDDAIEKWREFRTDYAKFVFGGMTVNERLFTAGTLEAFDRACAARDDDEVRRLLRDVLVDEPSIDQIVERLA